MGLTPSPGGSTRVISRLRSFDRRGDILATHFIIVKEFSACNRSTLAMFGLRMHASAGRETKWRSGLSLGIVATYRQQRRTLLEPEKSSSAIGIGAENDLSIVLLQPE